jgi:hypothetical protein
VVLSASEAVAYSVYTQATRQDLPPAADGPAGEKRFRLRAEPPAAWLKASVVLEIRRLGQGRLSIKPTPANLQVFVDKKPLKGPQLAEVETQAPHARIGFYFPPGGGPGALGVAITDFAVETEQPNAEANAATPAAEPPTPPQ